MPDIHINRGGQSFGPYPEDVARQHLEAGSLLPTDLAWHEGADGWKPLSEVLAPPAPPPAAEEPPPPPPPDGTATDGAPPPPDGDASGTPPPPDGDSSDSPPPPDDGGDKDTIHVTRRGDAIGPYPRAMASEYFTGGSLLPTDWGWHEGMEEWKPLYEVLDLPVPDQPVFNPAMAPQRGGGKGKKIAKIAGLAVLAIGLITAGILFIPKLLFGKIRSPEALAERVVTAYKENDHEAFFELSGDSLSYGEFKKISEGFLDELSDSDWKKLAAKTGKGVEEIRKENLEAEGEDIETLKKKFEEGRKRKQEFSKKNFERMRKSGEESGIDWSDVTIKNLETDSIQSANFLLELINSSSDSEFKSTTIYVTLASKGEEFTIELECGYAPSVGWLLD